MVLKIPQVKQVVTDLDIKIHNQVTYEFGGPLGVTLMMIGFPSLMYYFWFCLEYHQGQLVYPTESLWTFIDDMINKVKLGAYPSEYAIKVYMGYVLFSFILAYVMPGPEVEGLPVPSLKGKKVRDK